MALDPNKISIVHWFPDVEKHRCGYCKHDNCSISYGMWAETMTVEDYQNLIDRGWRRSGKYCYKPIMNETCCPQYTIRCDALNFKLSKSHKKVIKKFNKYLSDGVLNKESSFNNVHNYETEQSEIILKEKPNFAFDLTKLNTNTMFLEVKSDNHSASTSKLPVQDSQNEEKLVKKVRMSEEMKEENLETNNIKRGVGADPMKPPCKKAKLIRLERKQKKLQELGLTLEMNRGNAAKTLEQFLNEIPQDYKHKLKMKLLSPSTNSKEWLSNLEVEYDLYKKYQTIIHNDPPDKCNQRAFMRFLVNTPLKIQLIRMNVKHKLFKVSSKLFAKYQMAVHNDESHECDEKQFFEFLVDTPFQAEIEDDDDDEEEEEDKEMSVGFGSFHQQYWLDNKLIAVGVIDVLPRCISSVYFFYDPDYRNLTLGTYGSLRELELTRSLHAKYPSIEHYYMGFYIHSCPKMRYKGNLRPSALLCPETYSWFPIENCITKLDESKYSRLNEDTAAVDGDTCSKQDIDMMKILFGYNFTMFRNYRYRNRDKEVFDNIGRLVGKKCTNTLLFINERH